MPPIRFRFFPVLLFATLAFHSVHAEQPLSDSLPIRNAPTFWQAETPGEMAGMLLSEGLAGLGAGFLAGVIGGNLAEKHCKEHIDPDFSDECGWSGLGGALEGALIAAPLGQGLGVMLAGALANKHGNGLLTLVAAYGGDLASFLLFAGVYNALDGTFNGKDDQVLGTTTVVLASATMLAIPILTYSVSDYHVRFPMRPQVGWGPGNGGMRLGLRIAEVKF